MKSGKFITIEGTEGAGKSTVMQFVSDYLQNNNKKVLLTREPGGTAVAEEIRKLVLHSSFDEAIEPETELLMVFAARAQHLKKKIRPALAMGQWVISDRFVDASYAYQGSGRGVDEEVVRVLDQLFVGATYPDLTLLLDISPEQGFKRAEKRGNTMDRIEQEQVDFFVRVRQGYLQRAKQDAHRIRVIDASKSIAEVEDQVRHILEDFIKR